VEAMTDSDVQIYQQMNWGTEHLDFNSTQLLIYHSKEDSFSFQYITTVFIMLQFTDDSTKQATTNASNRRIGN
jgi:ribosome biogenesis protein Tsr3